VSNMCGICGRKLNEKDDLLSVDCGGDCWGCIGEIEADMGDEYSLAKVKEEFAKGLRPGWVDMNVNDSTNGLVVETRKDNFRILCKRLPSDVLSGLII
jgi:hypothetical protein